MSDEPNREPQEFDRVSRLSSSAAAQADDPIVQEYESRYTPNPKRKTLPRSYSTLRVSDEEKLWAAVAHASVWVTFLTGFVTMGFGVPVAIFIPLVIYLMYRKRSDYVAFHALQAFVLHLVGTVGALALLMIGGVVWTIGLVVAILTMFVLIGFVLVPLWGIVGIALVLAVFLMPFAMLVFGTVAAIETYNGRDYRYPFVGRWIDRQLAGGFLTA